MALVRLDHLFSPLDVGRVTLANRIVSSGHDTVMVREGAVSDELVAYHRARAAGGAGLLVAQVAGVHESARYTSHVLMANSDACRAGFERLAAAVHAYDTRLFGQLFHPGREVIDLDEGRRRVCVAPSAVPNERFGVTPRALGADEVDEVVAGYASAARRLVESGLDGVEVVASHGYLPAQFLNEHVNVREDRWGGSAQNRRRFLLEVLASVRAAVDGAPVGLRVSVDEHDPAGLVPDVVLDALAHASAAGLLDYVSVTTGTSATLAGSHHIVPDMGYRAGYVAGDARRVRAVCDAPLMLAGRVNQPQEAERLIAAGDADAVAMTRALICDPEMPRRARAGEFEDIRACVGCNQACIGHFQLGAAISCIQRPESGRETRFGSQRRLARAARVLVVGGGPGGLKAAAVAAERGASVDLYEATARLGGQVNLAQLLPGREEFGGVTTNLEREARRAGVRVHLSHELGAEDVAGARADLVVLATGARAYVPDVEVGEGAVILDHDAVLAGATCPPGRVLVADVGADWIGAGVAQLLRRRGHAVTLAVLSVSPGENLQQYLRDRQIVELAREHVDVVTLARLFGVDDDTAYLQHVLTEEPILVGGLSGVVTAGWRRARRSLVDEVRARGTPHVAIGDCAAPRTVEEAVYEGLEAATALV